MHVCLVRTPQALKHPYIVRYRNSFHEHGWLCIVMDYCEGGDLSKVIESAKRKLFLSNAIQFYKSCCNSYSYLFFVDFKEEMKGKRGLQRRRGQRLPEEQVLRWVTQALLALKYIHEKHVLHRDLKSGQLGLCQEAAFAEEFLYLPQWQPEDGRLRYR